MKGLSLFCFYIAIVFSFANAVFAQTVIFKETDGTQTNYSLDSIKKFTFQNNDINIHFQSGNITAYPLESIDLIDLSQQTLGVTPNSNVIQNIKFYPNPVSEILRIIFDETSSSDLSISIFDTSGKSVQESSVSQSSIFI